MEFAFIDEKGTLYFLDIGDPIPAIGEVFEIKGELSEELPGVYVAEFIESYMFSDVLDPEDDNFMELSEESEGLGFIGIAIREVSSMDILDIAKESMRIDLQTIKAGYEQISKVLENYRFEADE